MLHYDLELMRAMQDERYRRLRRDRGAADAQRPEYSPSRHGKRGR